MGRSCNNKIFQVHHLETRKTGGNRPYNLLTVCKECHDLYHRGNLKLNIKKNNGFRDAASMNIMRFELFKRLKERYNNIESTHGYITKFNRIQNDLEKSHVNDARCITTNFETEQQRYFFSYKFVRKNNRMLHKATILKGGTRKANKAALLVKGFKLFDKVKYDGIKCFIFGRKTSGYFDIRKLDGEVIHRGISFKKLKLIQLTNTLLCQWHPLG